MGLLAALNLDPREWTFGTSVPFTYCMICWQLRIWENTFADGCWRTVGNQMTLLLIFSIFLNILRRILGWRNRAFKMCDQFYEALCIFFVADFSWLYMNSKMWLYQGVLCFTRDPGTDDFWTFLWKLGPLLAIFYFWRTWTINTKRAARKKKREEEEEARREKEEMERNKETVVIPKRRWLPRMGRR
mmetsp:Transcript_31792/g.56122  ORF Transcript_31792/g.56122 Transcript_31792/m.56122 type:complete len:187 (+) Transcript_31792:42-602(+)